MGQKGMLNKGGRVVKDNTLFFMSARTCFTSVHTMKASNHTLHFFFSLSFESDIPNTKIRNCYQTPFPLLSGGFFTKLFTTGETSEGR